MLEGRSFLRQVITQEAKLSALRKDCSFVMDRSIFEMKYKTTGHAITVLVLNEISVSQRLSIKCSQDQETMDQAFPVSYGYLAVDPRGQKEHQKEEERCEPSPASSHPSGQSQAGDRVR